MDNNTNIQYYKVAVDKPLSSTKAGEVFQYPRLGDVAFERIKRGGRSFVCVQLSTGQLFSVRRAVDCKNFNVKVVGLWRKPVIANDLDKLTPGAMFVIKHKNDCLLYRFKCFNRNNRIIAINPLTGIEFTLGTTYVVTLLENLDRDV